MPTIPPGTPVTDLSPIANLRQAVTTLGQRVYNSLSYLVSPRPQPANELPQAAQALPAAQVIENAPAPLPNLTASQEQGVLGRRDFGPLQPLLPRYGADSPEQTGGPRRYQYPYGVNILLTPRREYPNLTPFEQLHNLSAMYDVIGMCIAARIEQICGMGWSITTRNKRDAKAYTDYIDYATEFFKRPDRLTPIDAWFSALVREHLITDAVTIYPHLTRGGELYALDLVDGSTIKPLIDDRGRTLSYQQIIYGFPASDYRNPDAGENDFPVYSRNELLYLPRFVTTRHPYGSPPTEWIILRVNQAIRKQMFDLAWFCYDAHTEIMTKGGWVKFSKLKGDEEVATRSADGEFQWQRPTNYIVTPYKGQLIHFTSKQVDLLVTPNHRMLVRRKWEGGKKNRRIGDWHIRQADEFLLEGKHFSRYHEMPATSSWTGELPSPAITLASPTPKKTGRAAGNLTIPYKAWCKFIGLFLAEGCVYYHHGYPVVSISQAPHSKRLLEVKETVGAIGLEWNYSSSSWNFVNHHRALSNELLRYGHGADGKMIPDEIKNLPPEYLGSIIDGMMLGDGYTTKDGIRRYSTISRQLADDLQEIMQKCGRDVSVRERRPHGELYGPHHPGRKPYYLIIEKQSLAHHVPYPKEVEYDGNVYCVTVPNGIVYVRRNGKAIWSGNSDGNIPDMIGTMPEGQMTPEQVADFELMFNALLEGNDAARRKIKFIPWAANLTELRQFSYDTALDQWMLNVTCAAYAVPPQELGFTNDVNRATAELQEAVNERRGLKPLSTWLKRAILDEIVQNWMGRKIKPNTSISFPGAPTQPVTSPFKKLEWQWSFGDKTDMQTQAQTDQVYVEMGVLTPEIVRAMRFPDVVFEPTAAEVPSTEAGTAGSVEEAMAAEFGGESPAAPPAAEEKPNPALTGTPEQTAQAILSGELAVPATPLSNAGTPTLGTPAQLAAPATLRKMAGDIRAEAEASLRAELRREWSEIAKRYTEAFTTPDSFWPEYESATRLALGHVLPFLVVSSLSELAGDMGMDFYKIASAAEQRGLLTRWTMEHIGQVAHDHTQRVRDTLVKAEGWKLSQFATACQAMLMGRPVVDALAITETTRVVNAPYVSIFDADLLNKALAREAYGNILIAPPLHPHCRCRLRTRKVGDLWFPIWWTDYADACTTKRDVPGMGWYDGCRGMKNICVMTGPHLGKLILYDQPAAPPPPINYMNEDEEGNFYYAAQSDLIKLKE